jgi:DNA polymerase-1
VLLELINAPVLKTKTGKYKLTAKDLTPLKGTPVGDYLVSNVPLEASVIKMVQEKLFNKTSQRYMFNLSSKHHLKRLFFTYLGEKSIHKTDKGADQVNDFFLTQMAEKYSWVKKLQTYNKLNKILGTYINRFLEEQEDGIFYPDFQQHGTVTARYSSDLQQLPRKLEGDDVVAKYTNMLRPCLIAGDGHKLVGADFAQLEITVFADDAGDPTLLNMIRNKEDFYSRVAIDIYNLGSKYSANKKADNFLKKLNPELRQKMKAVALGIRYGLEGFKLHHDLKITQEEAEMIIFNYFNAYPNLKRRMDELLASVKNKGYVSTKVGRRRRLPEIKQFIDQYGDENLNALELYKNYSDTNNYQMLRELRKSIHSKLNASLNFPIQSMAASIVNRAAIKITEDFKVQGLSAYIAAQIHDELVCRCPEIEVDKVKQIVQNRMENTTKLNVPLEAVPEVGDNYGEIK